MPQSPSSLSDAQLQAIAHGASQGPPASSASALPDRQLLAILANGHPNMNPLEDIGRSIVTGGEQGLTTTLGLPRTLSNLNDWVAQSGGNVAEYLTGHQLTDQQRRMITRAAHVVSASEPFGMAQPRAPGPDTLDRVVQHADAALGNAGVPGFGGGYHTPQTLPGRYAQTAGQMASTALMPGGLAARVARVALPAIGAQSAAEIAPDQYKLPARIAGGLFGGGLEGFGEGLAAAPAQAMARAAPNLTADQIGLAAALREHAAGMGVDLTIPEAVQQVTGGATGLGRLQRTLENATQTAPDLRGYFAARPGQVRNAVEDFTGALGPPGADRPGVLGLAANEAAQGAQRDAVGQRAALSRPYYDAADATDVDRDTLANILQSVGDRAAADRTGLLQPTLQRFRQSFLNPDGSPILDQGNLSTARNYWRDLIDLPPTSANATDKLTGGIIGSHLDDLDALLRANPERVMGDTIYAGASRNIVDPLNAGPVGKIAATPDIGEQTAALYPQNPPLGQPADTTAAIDALEAQREGLAAALTRQHIGNTFNQSTRDLTSGPNQYGGAAFVRAIGGNDEQAATLRAGLDRIDPTGEFGDRFDDLTRVLAATGQRERPGSMTASNQQDEAAMKAAPLMMRGFGGLGDPLEWTKNLSNWTGHALYNRKLDALSQMIRDPDTLDVLNAAAGARQPPNGPITFFLPAATQTQSGQP